MNVLHLSDTQLSGSPIRIVEVLNKYTPVKARHITWSVGSKDRPWRRYRADLVGSVMQKDELLAHLEWADVVHYHNRWKRQSIFQHLGIEPPKKPGVIQIHSPRESEDFSEETKSGLPIAVIAQYHPRQWVGEMRYLLPNVVDITHPEFVRTVPPLRNAPVLSYAPSSWNGKGWDDKSYRDIAPGLKRMHLAHEIYFQLIIAQPYEKVIEMKRNADIGIDEVSTGSYHLSSLEFLAMGIPCFANIDKMTFDTIKQMTGCERLPWIVANKGTFRHTLDKIIRDKSWQDLGAESLAWMKKYWAPELLAKHYTDMYGELA